MYEGGEVMGLVEDLLKRGLDGVACEVRSCTRCPLHRYRRNPVPGEGPDNARVMLIGEAPGEKEDEEGRPFVGPAGRLLTKLLESIGVKREEVFITNVVKCRPPNNRDPEPSEIEACRPFLMAQIRILKPKIIVCLGRHSAREVLRIFGHREWRTLSISSIRGRVFRGFLDNEEVFILPTYHPAAALYNPKLKLVLEEDFRKLKDLIFKALKGGSGGPDITKFL